MEKEERGVNANGKFIITKKIAKHGSQSIIVIPKILEAGLKPGTIVQLTIDIIDGGKE